MSIGCRTQKIRPVSRGNIETARWRALRARSHLPKRRVERPTSERHSPQLRRAARLICRWRIAKGLVMWVTADKPNLSLYAAQDSIIVRWYQEDQVVNIVLSDPMNVNGVTEINLKANGELTDVFD